MSAVIIFAILIAGFTFANYVIVRCLMAFHVFPWRRTASETDRNQFRGALDLQLSLDALQGSNVVSKAPLILRAGVSVKPVKFGDLELINYIPELISDQMRSSDPEWIFVDVSKLPSTGANAYFEFKSSKNNQDNAISPPVFAATSVSKPAFDYSRAS